MLQTLFFVQFAGTLGFGAVLLLWTDFPGAPPTVWLLALAISSVNMVGTALLYRAFTIGTLALVAPVASSFAVVTMALALFSGEDPSALALSGALLSILGILVVSYTPRGAPAYAASFAGLPEACGTIFCFGIYFWAVEFVTPSMGVLWPVLLVRVVEMSGALLFMLSRGSRPAWLSSPFWTPIVLSSLLSTMAFVCFNLGIGSGDTAIVTPLASLSSTITMLLGTIILRERLAAWQWGGVGVIMLGVLLVSL